jgi:subfamily B ATP-binding cassette protein MsbA
MNPPQTPVYTSAQIYRRLLSYARPHLGMFLIGVFGMVLFAATDGTFAFFVKEFMESTSFEGNRRTVLLIAVGAPLLFLLRGIGDYMSTYFPGYVGRQVIKAIRADLFRHYLHLPASYYDRAQGGMLLSKLTFNIEQVAEATTKSITVLISAMFWFNWRLA